MVQDSEHLERPLSPCSVAVGSFDGLHLGHRALIGRLKEIAGERDTSSLVVTFDPHPRMVLAPDSDFRLLTTVREKRAILTKLGVNFDTIIPFDDPYYNQMTPAGFVKWLKSAFEMEYMLIGFNHRFGRGGKGGAHNIGSLAEKYGFDAEVFPQQFVDGLNVSSSEVRRVVAEGDMTLAAKLLGDPYLVIADRGDDGLWRSESPAKLLPPVGCYRVVVNGCECECAVEQGGVVRFAKPVPEQEAHIYFIDKR